MVANWHAVLATVVDLPRDGRVTATLPQHGNVQRWVKILWVPMHRQTMCASPLGLGRRSGRRPGRLTPGQFPDVRTALHLIHPHSLAPR